jgi:hypothetical protein
MDINRLLSPDEGGPRAAPMSQQAPSNMPSPRKPRRPTVGGKRNQSNLSQEVRRSPERMDTSGQPSSASGYANPQSHHHHHHQLYQSNQQATPANFRPLHQSSQGRSEAQTTYGYVQAQSQPQRPVVAHRHSSQSSTRSTPQMDTLAGEFRQSRAVSRNVHG